MKFTLKTVSESEVLEIIKSLKPKKSYDVHGITAEILKIGAEVLVIPLTYMISFWKISWGLEIVRGDSFAKKCKKMQKKNVKNDRPVSLLPIFCMILKKIVAIQIEDFLRKTSF